jgi:hypothetical protein
LEMFLQQIEMTLGTPNSKVMGSLSFGVSLDYFLHTLNSSDSELKELIDYQIRTYCSYATMFNFVIETSFYKINNSDALIVDIIVEGGNLVRIVSN